MANLTDRRAFLKHVAAGAAGSCLLAGQGLSAPAATGTTPTEGDAGLALSAYGFGSLVWVRVGDGVFTCYRAEPGQKYPYFYPVLGPASGLTMTDETALPWPHHRSLFLGCDFVNNGNYWQDRIERGQIVSRGPQAQEDVTAGAVITDHCDWRQPGQDPIIEDRRQFTILAPSVGRRLIRADITLTARVDVHIRKTNHSLFSIRAARGLTPLGGGRLVNDHGQEGEKATFGQPALWCGFEGTRLGVTESIVLMDHPGNPWPQPPWFTRDYGFISPTPFFWIDDDGWRLPAGQSVRMRYQVVVAAGPIRRDEMSELHRAFAGEG